ncbi:hypothetical protein V498_07800 [Pseudogymnoascus sp. VKM F-4517 (FW-2822)]|nr:hypothetical protein V498_07800 [Pseudogymnoascus sp. VKM F-4517 (FW-2822)]
MSFGVGIGDIILLGTLTWKLYKNCKESSAEFSRISSEVASLHVVIKETEEYVTETQGLSPSRDARLTILIDGCKEVLTELESLLNNYESLGTQAQRSWDRVRWGLEELADVRSRIISNTSLLTAFNSSLANSSTARIEKRLNKFIEEVRAGLREGSVVTSSGVTESIDSEDVWLLLRRELEDVGISASVVEEHHVYISNWLKAAIATGMLEELDNNSRRSAVAGSFDSGYAGSIGGTSIGSESIVSIPSTTPSITVANEEFEAELLRRPSQISPGSSTAYIRPDVKVRRASSVSSVLFKMFKKETAIIEAASDGDISKVAKLISSGANVNARDRWGWSALSMCGYGGHVEICRLLLDHGAELDNMDVDGDTPESLATNRGHANIVIMLEEERAARDLKVREADSAGKGDRKLSTTSIHDGGSKAPRVGIVGAGISGLRCADILLDQGFQVTIFEARDRIGGRHATGDKHPIRDLAIETNTPLHHWNNQQNIFTSSGELLSGEKSSELSTLLWEIIEEAFEYSGNNGKSIPESASLYDYIGTKVKEKLPDRVEDQKLVLSMSEMWGAYVGDSVKKQSLRFSWMEECCGGDETFIETTYEAILDRIAKIPLEKANVRLGDRVDHILLPEDRYHDLIRLATKKSEVFLFDEIVVTVPLGLMKTVKDTSFSPGLPKRLCSAIDNISVGKLEKVYITFPSAFWTVNQADNFAGYTNWLSPKYAKETNPYRYPQEIWNLAAFSPENRRPTLLFYLYGDCSWLVTSLVRNKSTEEHYAILDDFFRPYYSLLPNFAAHDENCKPKAILSTDWQDDELSGYGSYCNFQVGIKDADEDVKVIRHGVPDQRLWFAGEYTAPFEELGTAADAYTNVPPPSSRYATPAHWGGLVGHGACSVTYSVQQSGHVPSHSVTVDTPEQSHPIVSVSRYTQSGTMHPEMLGHAGGTVDVMTAQGGGGGGVVVGQSVAVTTDGGWAAAGLGFLDGDCGAGDYGAGGAGRGSGGAGDCKAFGGGLGGGWSCGWECVGWGCCGWALSYSRVDCDLGFMSGSRGEEEAVRKDVLLDDCLILVIEDHSRYDKA